MEKVMSQAGRFANHYHAENGRFVDNGFVDAIKSKYQKLNFCGVRAHHQNSIIENKNKMFTTGAQTILLHGIIMWPQIIDDMFWPFSTKEVAERLNSLKLDILGRTPEYILQIVEMKDIPVNFYHTLFFPIYVLDARLQSDRGVGPQKWDPRSSI